MQRHGEHLSDGWTPVFRLLASVPAQKDAERIDLAFQSVQLTCSDYMAAMPFPRMKRCLEVAAMYGSQQVGQGGAAGALGIAGKGCCLVWHHVCGTCMATRA